jgi:4-amino-4-deoxy-L-arabinose transferase-like glycosyltransferase
MPEQADSPPKIVSAESRPAPAPEPQAGANAASIAEMRLGPRGPRAPTKREWIWSAVVAAFTFSALAATQASVGFVRDEGTYFRAASDYAGWYQQLVSSPGAALTRRSIDSHFAFNSEHPVLMKTLFGLSHLFFTDKLHRVSDAAGYRIPAWLATALLAAILYLFCAARVSHRAGLFAVVAYLLVPRQFFNSTLACFDGAVATFWLATVYAYWRSLDSRRWAVLTGVFFGCSIAVKHNGYFIPPVLVLHYGLTALPAAWAAGKWRAVVRGFPRAFLFMAVLGPVIFFAHWPYIWFDTVQRLSAYIAFHTNHINYPWQYMGRLLMDPPFPVSYPFVLTALTVPLSIVVLMATGLFARMFTLGRSVMHGLGRMDSGDLLIVLNALVPMAIIAMPSVPHFGGVKHWLASMPFLLILGGEALERCSFVVAELIPKLRKAAFVGLAGLVAIPALVGSVHIHPYGTSYYNELAGGSPGAATIGMQRQFWSNNVTGVLPWLNQNAPVGSRVWFHEVPYDSYEGYRRNGMLRPDIQYAMSADDSNFTLYQYMQEFRDQEFQVWTAYGTARPVFGLYLDEVPNVVVYRRP